MRGTGHHRPYERQQRASDKTVRGWLRGSSSPLRGAATRPARPGRKGQGRHHRPYEGQQRLRGRHGWGSRSRHHRPYEGQQLDHAPGSRAQVVRHHRPYEGQQPRRDLDQRDDRRQVIIAPTRGSNWLRTGHLIKPSRGVIIAPTRGSNCHCSAGQGLRPEGHHRPYEGQQLRQLAVCAAAGVQSSSPLRGAATGRRRRSSWAPQAGSSSLLLGAATVWTTQQWKPGTPRSSSPYEGQQRSWLCSIAPTLAWVIIAPTRGRTSASRTSPSGPRRQRFGCRRCGLLVRM